MRTDYKHCQFIMLDISLYADVVSQELAYICRHVF